MTETDYTIGLKTTYTYDNAGNITQKRVESLSGSTSPVTVTYTYGDSVYGDRLTSYNGESITYDEFGRTTYYRCKTISYYEYDFNRIQSIGNVSFTYDAEGMRASKTVNGVTHYYTYDGLKLIREEWGNNTLVFLYDASGSPIGMQYRTTSYAEDVWDTYYYEKNLQGDVIAIYSATGTKLVNYAYDPFGRLVSITDGNGNDVSNNGGHLANINPIKYRGYYYDADLDLYYLATRYYDPETCRFITQDSALYHGMLGYNMYAYCNNNPVNYVDYTGESGELVAGWGTTMWWLNFADGLLPIGDILFWSILCIFSIFSISNENSFDESDTATDENDTSLPVENPDKIPKGVEVPDVKYPGDDPTVAPDGYEWKGKDPQGGKDGGYKNKAPGKRDSFHPDLNHPEGIEPHWDYNDSFKHKWRIFPDRIQFVK